MFAVAVFAGCLIIGWLQGRGIWQAGKRKDLLVFAVMMTAATVLAVLQAAQIKLPNPVDWLGYLFNPVGIAINSILS